MPELSVQGLALAEEGKFDEAMQCFKQALSIEPQNPKVLSNFAIVLRQQNRLEEAEALLAEALKFAPDSPELAYNLASVLYDLKKLEESKKYCSKTLNRLPNLADAHLLHGNIMKDLYQIEEAIIAYEQVLEIDSNHAEAWRHLASLKSLNDLELEKIKSALHNSTSRANDTIQLSFALGNIYDQHGDYDNAFNYYQKGNTLKHQETSLDLAALKEKTDRTISTYDNDFFTSNHNFGSDSHIPVFIVGLPRSGKTLVENIIKQHPQAHGAGELDRLEYLATNPSSLKEMAQKYQTRLMRDAQSQVTRATDTMPTNCFHLGLAAQLFPNAHVIYCQRNPRDTALQIYFTYFAQANEFAWNLEDIGFYTREIERLMEHWKTNLSLPILEIQYEDLIADTENKAKEIIDFLKLKWNESCVQNVQLDSREINHWKHYESQLGPLVSALENT